MSIKQVFFAAGSVIVFLMLADFNNRWNERQNLEYQHEQAVAERDALQMTATALQAQIEYASSRAAVEGWAYQEGGMARPGDHVIVPMPAPGGPPTPTPTPPPTTAPSSNWDVWWSLFFDAEEDEAP